MPNIQDLIIGFSLFLALPVIVVLVSLGVIVVAELFGIEDKM